MMKTMNVPIAETFAINEKSDNEANGIMTSNMNMASRCCDPVVRGVSATNPRIASEKEENK